jgi:hypothetical protein
VNAKALQQSVHILSHPPMPVALSKYPGTKVAICDN